MSQLLLDKVRLMKVLVTGAAGFIGFHVTKALLERGDTVIGIDNINDYYDVKLKEGRLNALAEHTLSENFTFIKMDVADRQKIENLFAESAFDKVVHLAAQAGVRYSIENPHAYVDSNLIGFMNILEGCRHNKIKHLVYASSSTGQMNPHHLLSLTMLITQFHSMPQVKKPMN